MDGETLGATAKDNLTLRKKFEAKKGKYERMLNLISLIINSSLIKKKIKIHSLQYRVKKYSSFLEKIERKRYAEPFKECTDIAGCRIICLFLSQIEEIQKIIESEFQIIELTNKRSAKKFDQFGYLSLHMLIQIPKNRQKFIEFSDLKDLVCEIQIRTILQEAWAEIEHYLNYKATKEEKDQELLRKIYSLSGMFEVADSTFEEINSGFNRLIEKKVNTDVITALNLYKYSLSHFPWFDAEWDKKQERAFYQLSNEIKRINIKSISQLNTLMNKYKIELERYEQNNQKKGKKPRYFNPVGLIRAALALEFGKKFDLVFGLRGYSEKVRGEVG